MENNLEMCVCGHGKWTHELVSSDMPYGICMICPCSSFRPQKEQWDSKEGQTHYENDGCGEIEHNAPSQPSMEEIISNPANIEKAAKKSNEMQRETVRDEKIARIVKEFREEWKKQLFYLSRERAEAWLTQTLTTLLDEE